MEQGCSSCCISQRPPGVVFILILTDEISERGQKSETADHMGAGDEGYKLKSVF